MPWPRQACRSYTVLPRFEQRRFVVLKASLVLQNQVGAVALVRSEGREESQLDVGYVLPAGYLWIGASCFLLTNQTAVTPFKVR